MVIPNDAFLSKNELPVRAQLWSKGASSLLPDTSFLLLKHITGPSRLCHGLAERDHTHRKTLSHWLTKWRMPLTTKRYHSNTLNCTARIWSSALTASSQDCHQPRQAPESLQPLLTEAFWASSLTAPEQRVEAAAVVCCAFVLST